MNHLFEDDAINILTQHVKEEPVAHLCLLDDGVDTLLLDKSEPDVQEVDSHPWAEDNHGPVNADQSGQTHEEDQPEPEEDVDFFIDNVKRQDAHRIVLLYLSGCSKFVEGALCHAWEDVDHGINAVLLQ